MCNQKMSDYEHWENEQFLAKAENKHWLNVINDLKNLKIEDDKSYAVLYIPFKGRKEQRYGFEKVEFVSGSRIGIFTFDDKLSLPAVEIVDLIIEENQDWDFTDISGLG